MTQHDIASTAHIIAIAPSRGFDHSRMLAAFVNAGAIAAQGSR